MASITELVNSFNVNSKEFESLVHDLIVNNNDVPFDNQEIEIVQNTIITGINVRINEANTRYNGLVILDKILCRCSKDILSKYSLLWITKATQVLENMHSTMKELTLAHKVLGFLVEHCKKIPELHKQISIQHVKQLVNALSNLKTDTKNDAAYYLLAVLLYHYPEVCERFQEMIMKMILLQIDSTQENLVNASAKCYVLLSKVIERSFKPPPAKSIYTGWTYNEALLCNNLHAIMDQLFSGLIELENVDIWDQLELPPISEENVVQYYNEQKQRFLNLCTYLSLMLRGYETRNSVLPNDILGVLCRGLAITPLNLKDRTCFKEQMLYIILPKLQIGLITVLKEFINGFAQELIPFGGTILQLFQQTLQWTDTVLEENYVTFSANKPFKYVRIHTYNCLSSWLMNTSSLSGIETIANSCLSFILKDITPEPDRILLTVQKTQCLSKRARKRFKDSQYENSPILNNGEVSTISERLDADLCREALVVLQNVLFSGGVLLKQTFYKTVQKTVISLLHHFYLSSSGQGFYKNHDKCRLELFKVLKVLQMNPHTALAFPIEYCLEISHMASYDVDLSITQEAKLALAEIEKIIHPAAPTLQLPRQQKPDDEFFYESRTEDTVTTLREPEKWTEQELSQEHDTI